MRASKTNQRTHRNGCIAQRERSCETDETFGFRARVAYPGKHDVNRVNIETRCVHSRHARIPGAFSRAAELSSSHAKWIVSCISPGYMPTMGCAGNGFRTGRWFFAILLPPLPPLPRRPCSCRCNAPDIPLRRRARLSRPSSIDN